MLTRRILMIAATTAALSFPAFAADSKKFDMKAFQAAQAAGKSIVVEVHADWCPVCTKQKPVSASLRARPEFQRAEFFTVDFDSQKEALTHFKVSKQSTIISFKGKEEKGRSTGVSDPAEMEKLFRTSL